MYPHPPMSPHHHHPTSSTHGLTPVIYSSMVHVRTSSEWNANHNANHILLNGHHDTNEQSSAWCALKNDHNQYVMVGSGDLKTFFAITTQGRGHNHDNQWVSSYKVKFSYDGVTYHDYCGGAALCGNNDKDTPVTNYFNPPIQARSIMIQPVSWNNHISMRMELYAKLQ